MNECVWMKVTHDKYELPVAVANTATELGKILNVHPNVIRSAVCHAKKSGHKSVYVKVEF